MIRDKLIPKRRFKEFENDGEWKERKLGDISIVKTGYAFNSNDFDDNGELLVITNGNIQKDSPYVDGLIGNKIDIKENTILNEYILNENDILVTMDGTVGRTAKVMEERQILAQRVGRLIAKLEPEFLYQYLNTGEFFNKMTLISHGGTIKHISLTEISDYMSHMPSSKEEQKKIGTFFKNHDNLITLHQDKLNKLKELKLAYLSEMFPEEGEKYPKRRFAGFTDPWEQFKLGDLVERVSVSSIKEFLPRVEYEDIVSGQGVLTKDFHLKKNNKKGNGFKRNDILFGYLRPYLNNRLLAYFDGIAVGDWWVLRSQKYNANFVYSLIQTQKFQGVANLSTGTKMPRANWNTVASSNFFIPPNIEEQTQIGTFFQNLDNLITLHQRKLEKLEDIKKAYLNEMFV